MAGKMSSSSPSLFSIGNCKVEIEGNKFIYESSNTNNLQISVSDVAKIKISVDTSRKYVTRKYNKDLLNSKLGENDEGEGNSSLRDHLFLLVNPKDIDSRSKSLLQEVLRIYMSELPSMNFAANTGKESLFLERCVSNGKYYSLLLKSNAIEGSGEVIAAVTYQIIPADTQYAEIPLAAVSSNYQHKGFGCLLYLELRKRLQSVGIRTIFCWGDKESEGFWLKQGFVPIAEVDSKGKARRLPIKAGIRRALCFPGGSTLMVAHLNKEISIPANPSHQSKPFFSLKPHTKSPSSVPVKSQELGKSSFIKEGAVLNENDPQIGNSQSQLSVKDGSSTDVRKFNGSSPRHDSIQDCKERAPLSTVECNNVTTGLEIKDSRNDADGKHCSCSGLGVKRGAWEASLSSLKSKKVKGGHHIDCHLDVCWEHDRGNISCFDASSVGTSKGKSSVEVVCKDSLNSSCSALHTEESRPVHNISNEDLVREKIVPDGECHRIMLMNIADDAKKTFLTKIIEELGGAVTSDGSVSTHVVTGKARKTLNFCTALCSGSWIISTNWLKESFRECKFVDEFPFILQDRDYVLKYRSELKDAVLRANAHPRALFKGYDICLAKHVQPPVDVLSAIVRSAGGNVLRVLGKVREPSGTIFIACEEDMEEALLASKRGLWTYSSDWFMNCVMRQELDLQAPQFAESL